MNRQPNFQRMIQTLQNRVNDLEKINDEKLCLIKLAESLQRVAHDISVCQKSHYISGKDWDKLDNDLTTALYITQEKISGQKSHKKQYEKDDVLFIDQKAKFFNTEAKAVQESSKKVREI